jgi:hypothetical protein
MDKGITEQRKRGERTDKRRASISGPDKYKEGSGMWIQALGAYRLGIDLNRSEKIYMSLFTQALIE